MKDEYDDFEDNDQHQYVGLGASKKNRMSKNQQIYGDFYQAYEQQQPQQFTPKPKKSYGDAYNRFKAGSVIQNYAAQCDVHIPEPKKKVKLHQNEQQPIQQPEVGQFNLQSFLRDFQQKQQLQKIQQEQDEEDYNGPFCLNSKVKNSLKLINIGQDDSADDEIDENNLNVNEMTFEQYKRLVMKNGKKEQSKPQKKLTVEEKQKQKEFIASYGKGYSMLQKMGFNLSKGLGKDQKGITKPVEAVFKTAFTTKDSQLRQQNDSKQQQPQEQDEQTAAETALFQYRSKNIKINNFLLDLKNKFESVTSKTYFYEREIQQVDRETEISQSLRLQKMNQLEQYEEEIGKLKAVRDLGKDRFMNGNINAKGYQHNKQELLHFKNAHLALKYKMDLLEVKTHFMYLKSLPTTTLLSIFPTSIKKLHTTLNNFYLQKQRQTLKHYRDGIKNFRDSQRKVVNLQEDVIDLIDETEPQSVVSVSIEDQLRITRMMELVAENTVGLRAREVFDGYKKLEEVRDFKVLECLRAVKEINRNSELVKSFINEKIKPLVMRYYESFEYEQLPYPQSSKGSKESKHVQSVIQSSQPLPHHVLFPLFQIMDPLQLQLSKLLKVLSKKHWNLLKSPTLHSIIKPLLPYCPSESKQHFINFYLAPRLLYFLEQFDLTQPHICKQLMTMLKLHKQLIDSEILKDLLNCTIVPEIVMTYKKYEEEGTGKKELKEWVVRWVKEIGRVVPNHLQEVLANDFNIYV